MYRSRICRWVILAAALLSFGIATGYFTWVENHSAMGVRILSREQRDAYNRYQYEDLSRFLEFNGEPAAVDVDSSTIYISQDIGAGTQFADLPGSLTVTHKDYTLRFAQDDRFSDLAAAVEEGHRFSLLAAKGTDSYMEYQVVFTTLPVMRLDGYYSHINPELREVMLGDVCLWAANDPTTGRYSVKTSTTEWHVRGGTTASLAKKPWKLSLEKEYRKNNNVDFLGMGADDDWILNPMVVDDTKMKENLFMQLWNTLTEQSPWNHRMSTGEYVELVRNQSYEGVYLLQRRIDDKYLQLSEQDILLKGGSSYAPESLEVAYQIQHSPLSEGDTFSLMEGFYTGEDTSVVNLENFVDTNLFLHFAVAVDNMGYKNMFYLLEKETDGYRLSLLPWDTDMSWGMIWINMNDTGGFFYDYDLSMGRMDVRQEYSSVRKQVPELDILMAKRWQQLRQGIMAEEYILAQVEQMSDRLRRSGVLHRDQQRWGLYFDGDDTVQMLQQFLRERLQLLDAEFGAVLQQS